jgi:pimeloyl-ACP methyl ester carboxylesterase
MGVLLLATSTFLVSAADGGASTPAVPKLSLGQTSVFSVKGITVAGTPSKYDKVMVRRFGSPSAANVLVLVPGTSGGGGDFDIVGPYLASHVPNLQVWAENRREGALEDNAELLKALHGKVTLQQAFDYYLGWIANPKITTHYQPLKASQYSFVDQWGLATAMGDLHNVIDLARHGGKRTVILGGHSLGGSEASIYAAWDFNGRPGYKDIAGIIGIDGDAGGSGFGGTTAITTASQANAALSSLSTKGPWLDLLGTGLPWSTGAFAELGALSALKSPNAASTEQTFPLLPKELKPPVPSTNLAQLGYAFDASTSPAALALVHVHSGHLAASGKPVGWVNDGPTPAQDIAFAFAQEPVGAVDWYYPERLSIDTEAASSLQQTPAATALGLKLTEESGVDVPMFVIQTSLGGANNAVEDAALNYQAHSKIPSVTVVNKAATYGHLDPLLAAPSDNAFVQNVIPWIKQLPGYKS